MAPVPTIIPSPTGGGKSPEQRRHEFGLVLATVGVLGAALIGVAVTSGTGETDAIASAPPPSTAVPLREQIDFQLTGIPDLEGDDLGQNAAEGDEDLESARADGGCTIGSRSVRLGSSGDGVACLQDALSAAGYYDGLAHGEFDQSTANAVMGYQTAEDLYVDGVVGRESAIELDIWPDEESLVTRTAPPTEGATDLWGVKLSPVASAGNDAPPLPDDSGSGRRVVYSRDGQRVWAVSADEEIIRSWLVAGSKYNNEVAGTHEVYSRSDMSTAWNGKAWLPQMIRWLKTDIGAIGFHAIPLHVNDNSPYMTTSELGTRLSGGCQRQHNLDAQFMWGFATIGTPVIVT
jgi:peptidoglycan hydrolase-like protein with peptidoglycan-binding domain